MVDAMRDGRKWLRKGKQRQAEEALRQDLEESLSQTRLLLAQAYAGFNSAADQELVESYIYEIQALQTRYSYLLRQRKALEPHPPKQLPAEPKAALPVA